MSDTERMLWGSLSCKSVYRHILWSRSLKNIFLTQNQSFRIIHRYLLIRPHKIIERKGQRWRNSSVVYKFHPWFYFYQHSVGVSCKSYLTRKLSGMVIYYQLTKLSLIMCTFKRAIFEPWWPSISLHSPRKVKWTILILFLRNWSL